MNKQRKPNRILCRSDGVECVGNPGMHDAQFRGAFSPGRLSSSDDPVSSLRKEVLSERCTCT